MRPVHVVAFALCVAAGVPVARADDASRKAKAAEMLELTQASTAMKQQLQSLEERVNTLAKQQAPQGTATPEQTKLTEDYTKQINQILEDEVSWNKLGPVIVESYSNTFTEPELDSIIAFYKTPGGKAIVEKSPGLIGNTNKLVTDHIREMQPKLQQLTQDYATKMKAASPATPAAAPGAAKPAPSLATPPPAR